MYLQLFGWCLPVQLTAVGHVQLGEIDIVEVRGNANYYCNGNNFGRQIGQQTLHWGADPYQGVWGLTHWEKYFHLFYFLKIKWSLILKELIVFKKGLNRIPISRIRSTFIDSNGSKLVFDFWLTINSLAKYFHLLVDFGNWSVSKETTLGNPVQ